LAAMIGKVLADSDLREGLVRKGLLRAGQFTWEAAGEKLLTIYERLHEQD